MATSEFSILISSKTGIEIDGITVALPRVWGGVFGGIQRMRMAGTVTAIESWGVRSPRQTLQIML